MKGVLHHCMLAHWACRAGTRDFCSALVAQLEGGGGAHSPAGEGLGESQFRRGDIHCSTLYIYVIVLCATIPTTPRPHHAVSNS
jgi:hypothetical protein